MNIVDRWLISFMMIGHRLNQCPCLFSFDRISKWIRRSVGIDQWRINARLLSLYTMVIVWRSAHMALHLFVASHRHRFFELSDTHVTNEYSQTRFYAYDEQNRSCIRFISWQIEFVALVLFLCKTPRICPCTWTCNRTNQCLDWKETRLSSDRVIAISSAIDLSGKHETNEPQINDYKTPAGQNPSLCSFSWYIVPMKA
jgi:hypothetical protein